MAVDQRVLDSIALSRDEYELIVSRLGRELNEVELGTFGALWSEHCGYKNWRPLLRQLPGEGPYVLTRCGAENAVPAVHRGVRSLGHRLVRHLVQRAVPARPVRLHRRRRALELPGQRLRQPPARRVPAVQPALAGGSWQGDASICPG